MFNIIKFIKERAQLKILKSPKEYPLGQFLNLKEIKTVGFIYNISGVNYIDDIKIITNILNKVGVLYSGLAIETRKGILPSAENADNIPDEIKLLKDYDITPIENLHLNWIGLPTSVDLDNFLDRDFDLFIDFNPNNNFTLEYITREIKAKCIVGMQNNIRTRANIVFDGEGGLPLSYDNFLNQTFHYLSVIQSVRR